MNTIDYAEGAKALLELQARCREWGQVLRNNGWDDSNDNTHAKAAQTADATAAELAVMGLIKKHEAVLMYCRSHVSAAPSISLDRAFDYIGQYLNSMPGVLKAIPAALPELLAVEVRQPRIEEQHREPTFIVQLGRWAKKLGEKVAEGNGGDDPDNESRCVPMSKAEIARRLLDDPEARSRDAEEIMQGYGLKREGGSKWTIRLDKLDRNARRRMTAPRRS